MCKENIIISKSITLIDLKKNNFICILLAYFCTLIVYLAFYMVFTLEM